MPGQRRGDGLQRVGAHEVVIAHEEAVVTRGEFDQPPDVAVVAEIDLVLVIAD